MVTFWLVSGLTKTKTQAHINKVVKFLQKNFYNLLTVKNSA